MKCPSIFVLNLIVIKLPLSNHIKIKASAIDNLTDGRFFAAAGVEWIGFPADYSQNKSLTKVQILEVKEWLYGPRYVLETGQLGEDEVNELCQFTGIYNVQSTRKLNVADLAEVQSLIREVAVDANTDLAKIEELIAGEKDFTAQFLLKMKGPSAGWQYWDQNQEQCTKLKTILKTAPCILEMGFDQNNVLHLIETFQPFAISILGSGEEEVGLKTFDEVADLMERLES